MFMVKYSVECWVYDFRQDCFLLLRCPATQDHPEYWQPITGGRHKNEPVLQACVREVQEETGILLGPEQVELVIPEFSFCIPNTRVELRKPVYLALVYEPEVILSPEHIDFGWFVKDQVNNHLHWDSNRQSFAQVLAHVHAQK